MAKVSFETAAKFEESRPRGSGANAFEFFTLRNDGDSAVVRFMYHDVSEFEIYTCHNVTVDGKQRKVSCIRDPHDAVEACPLCASGNSISNRFFIKMVEYRMDDAGNVSPVPVVWERSMTYATRLKSMLDEYGPLEDCLFKVKRNGAAGSQDTTYEIMYCSPRVYADEAYPRVPDAFNNVNILGTLIMNKNYQELTTFVSTGSFPVATKAPDVAPPQYTPKVAPAPQYPSYTGAPAQAPATTTGVPSYEAPAVTAAPAVQPAPVMPPVGAQPQQTMQRPVRYY